MCFQKALPRPSCELRHIDASICPNGIGRHRLPSNSKSTRSAKRQAAKNSEKKRGKAKRRAQELRSKSLWVCVGAAVAKQMKSAWLALKSVKKKIGNVHRHPADAATYSPASGRRQLKLHGRIWLHLHKRCADAGKWEHKNRNLCAKYANMRNLGSQCDLCVCVCEPCCVSVLQNEPSGKQSERRRRGRKRAACTCSENWNIRNRRWKGALIVFSCSFRRCKLVNCYVTLFFR